MTRLFDAARKGDAFWQRLATETTVMNPRWLKQAERTWRFGRETFQQVGRRPLTDPVRSRTTDGGDFHYQP